MKKINFVFVLVVAFALFVCASWIVVPVSPINSASNCSAFYVSIEDIGVVKASVTFDVPSTAAVGEEVTIKGAISAGDYVDIIIKDHEILYDDKAVDENNEFDVKWDTAGYTTGSYTIEVYIDLWVGPPPETLADFGVVDEDGSTTIILGVVPVASFTYSPEKAMVGGTITFDASSSYDPDGEIVEYEWDFGDGNITPTADKVVDHIYEHPNDYTITLTVMDDDELKNSTSKDIDLSLKTGDLLLCRSPWSLVPGEWTHVGMYIGNDQVVEALKGSGVKITPLTNWSYPTKKCVEALRVKTTDEIRGKAVEFALRQEDKPYNLTLLSKNATEESSWYCSELVWAAYYNQGINIENGPDHWAITPTEILLDDDTEVIGWHKEHCPVRFFIITLWSPADLNVTDPDGFSIDKESMGISGAIYGEDDLDDDGDPDDWIGLPERKIGNYLMTVLPEPDAAPTDTYTLEVSTEDTTTVLAENVSVSEIPTEPYIFESKAVTFDTGSPANPYPSIFGTHNGTIKLNQTIIVSKLYTYPCAGTGGHTEYARIWNSTMDVNATWNGYVGDWHNITFDEPFTLFAEKTYCYEVRTGSYPQIIHTDEWEAKGGMGIINLTMSY